MLLGATKAGHVFVVDSVRDELARQVPDLVELFDANAPGWVRAASVDEQIRRDLNELELELNRGRLLRGHYPPQNIRKYMTVADPVVALHARRYEHLVVSKELSDITNKKGPKLPDLCAHFGVLHASPDAFARALGYRFPTP